MLAAEHYPYALTNHASLPKHELLEIHRSKISLHHAKTGYDYPTIQLPRIFSRLAGLSTRIYQTVQQGVLAFLVVISLQKMLQKLQKPPSSHGGDPEFESQRAHLFLLL